jgi:hypothetical protein
MNVLTERRLESTPLSHRSSPTVPVQGTLSGPTVDLSVQPPSTPSRRSEVSPMYSPISLAFFGLTGTAVGAAGVTGNFGGLTSLIATAATLLVMFVLFLAARSLARRNVNR